MRGSRFDHAVNPRIAHWQRKVPVCTRIGEPIGAREGAALVTWRTVCWISCRANCAAFLFASMRRLRIVVPGDVVVVSEGVVVGNRDYGPVSRVRRLGDGALRVECRGGSFLLRPASCSTDVVLAVLRALAPV